MPHADKKGIHQMDLDWNQLFREMLATGEFHASGLDVTTLARDYSNDLAVIRHDGTRITAYGALEATKRIGSFEVRRLYVGPSLKNNGALWSIVYELMAKAPRDAELFLITKSPAVMRVAQQRGFEQVTKVTMSEVKEWAIEIGLSTNGNLGRLPKSAMSRNPPRTPYPKERWLYVRRLTVRA